MENWIIPCNTNFFDIRTYLNENNNEVVWQTSSDIKVNDTVFIYLSGKKGEIKYKGIIKKINLDYATIQKNKYAIRATRQRQDYVLIKIEQEFPDGTFPIDQLRINGLKQFQKQSRAKESLIKYLKREI